MTVREIIEKYNGQYAEVEVFAYRDKSHRIHTDFLEDVDSYCDEEVYMDKEVKDAILMGEEEYGSTVLANDSMVADFKEWYGSKDAKVLVIILDENWDDEV